MRLWSLVVLAVGLHPGAEARAGSAQEDVALALTIVRGVQARELAIVDLRSEMLQACYLSEAAQKAEEGKPRGLPPEIAAMRSAPRSDRSLTWLRVATTTTRQRVESVALHPGKNRAGIEHRYNEYLLTSPWQLVDVRGPDGRSTDRGDYVRGAMLWDGERVTRYSSNHPNVTIRPQDWTGSPASAPVVGTAFLLAPIHGETFGTWLGKLLEPGKADEHSVDVERVNAEGREELVLRTRWVAGSLVSDFHVTVVPEWGYAVRRYESAQVTEPAPPKPRWGRGTLLVGEDFREVDGGIWMPFRTLEEQFEYSEGRPQLTETWETRMFTVTVNQGIPETEFVFAPPLGVLIQDISGVAPAVEGSERLQDVRLRQQAFPGEPVPVAESKLNAQPRD